VAQRIQLEQVVAAHAVVGIEIERAIEHGKAADKIAVERVAGRVGYAADVARSIQGEKLCAVGVRVGDEVRRTGKIDETAKRARAPQSLAIEGERGEAAGGVELKQRVVPDARAEFIEPKRSIEDMERAAGIGG